MVWSIQIKNSSLVASWITYLMLWYMNMILMIFTLEKTAQVADSYIDWIVDRKQMVPP